MATSMLLVAGCLAVLNFPVFHASSAKDEFHEEAFVKPLDSGHLYMHFQFTTTWDINMANESAYQHYRLFPKSLGEVLSKYGVRELHLSQTQGLWRYEKWGYPINGAPPGAELWVWFQETVPNIDKQWTDLINVLSGIFCSSLNFMDSKATVNPRLSFRPQGLHTSRLPPSMASQFVRYAALPREMVCTENLAPWKKLLPCSGRKGLASLFNSLKLFDTHYHSLGVHFRPICKNAACTETSVELTQSLSVVFEPPVSNNGRQDWTFRKLFGIMLGSSCPLASTSRIYVDLASNKTLEYYFTLEPPPSRVEKVTRGNQKLQYAVYEVPDFVHYNRVLNLAAKYNKALEYRSIAAPELYAHRFQTGYGQEKGGIMCMLYNNHPTSDLMVIYMETVPWYLRLYLHTLTITSFHNHQPNANGTVLKPAHIYYKPGKDRQRSYHLELILKLPANSFTQLSIEFDRALLKWTEYPPDANHGFYVNSAVVTAMLSDAEQYTATPQSSSRISAIFEDKSTSFFVRLHTESLLVMLPTPDFSMPYNVICLACTVVAIAFGSIHNLTTRRFVAKDQTKQTGIVGKVKKFFSRFFRKKDAATAGDASSDDVATATDSPTETTEESRKDR